MSVHEETERLLAQTEDLCGMIEPVLHGTYPEAARAELLPPEALIAPGDMSAISAPIDFLGLNYYSPRWLQAV